MDTLSNACSGMTGRMVPNSLRSLAGRRTLVVAAYSLGFATLGWAWADLGEAISFPAILATIAFSLYWGAIKGLTDRPDHAVDERERMVRDSAHKVAFQFLAWFGFPVAIGVAAVFPDNGGMQSVWAFVIAWLMAWGLPSAYVAWTQPDEAE